MPIPGGNCGMPIGGSCAASAVSEPSAGIPTAGSVGAPRAGSPPRVGAATAGAATAGAATAGAATAIDETFAMSPRAPKAAAVVTGATAAVALGSAAAGTAALTRRPASPVTRPPRPASRTRLGRLRPGRPSDSGIATVASGGCRLDRLMGGKPPRLQSSPHSRPLSLLRAVLPVLPELEVEFETVLLLAVPRSPELVLADSLFLLADSFCDVLSPELSG